MSRFFIALELSDKQRHEVAILQNELKHQLSGVRWVKGDGLHLTLKFIGETDDSNIDLIKNVIDKAARSFKPFELDFSGSGVFPSTARARVIWVAVKKGYSISTDLADKLDSDLAGIGIKPEKRSYHPHLTLGRIRQPIDEKVIKDMLDATDTFITSPALIEGVTLFESILTRQGAQYRSVHWKRFDN
ncbi:MAG: RNA 2',3'-cyclic phosphodiesterase [Bacillota bacterium]|nr:RNA 2',3'-cyclic phosphodiesterase [Bacillota bacterium]